MAQRARRSDGALAVRAARTLVILDRPLRDRNGFAIPLLAAQRIAKARPRQGDAGQADTFPGVWRPRENAARDPPCFLGMPNAQFATRDGQQQMGRKSRVLRTRSEEHTSELQSLM